MAEEVKSACKDLVHRQINWQAVRVSDSMGMLLIRQPDLYAGQQSRFHHFLGHCVHEGRPAGPATWFLQRNAICFAGPIKPCFFSVCMRITTLLAGCHQRLSQSVSLNKPMSHTQPLSVFFGLAASQAQTLEQLRISPSIAYLLSQPYQNYN